ncbi:MAG: nucleoid occlusion factor SlmA [Gammaproteobacteria bacterium]|nr:nucleoid occlusion factor SlmA [Gammaproteobacteria bacterium]MCP5200514.1 nucleoid occlusion factor SlmA [Gammaproteobacteria bacterium]
MPRSNRRQNILEVLARELETKPGSRITTAALAAAVGVSEAALYRHFASKAQMFEALIAFAEESVFGLFNQVMREQKDTRVRCQHLCLVLLGFAERNPGIARILTGDILVGEHARLRARVQQFFARVETQFRQVMRERNLAEPGAADAEWVQAGAVLLTALVGGRIGQFVRSEFTDAPSRDFDAQWQVLSNGLFAAGDANG